MATRITADRLRNFLDLILQSLDDDVDGETIARRAFVSPYHFNRLIAGAIGEAPGAFRRRLLLERAAWQIGRLGTTVTEASLDAGFESVEGFERAFRRSYATQPSRFKLEDRGFRLRSENGIHFHPPGALFVPAAARAEEDTMDLTDRLIEHDLWFTERLLERAADLSDEALDRPIPDAWPRLPFDAAEPTARAMFERIVSTKENWVAAVSGRPEPTHSDSSIHGLRERWKAAGPEFAALARSIKNESSWDAGFIDASCEPPESFTFGGMLAHVVTFSAYRRQILLKALRELGIHDVGIGDPVEWERSLS